MIPGPFGRVWRYPYRWADWLLIRWYGLLDRTIHRFCLPPLRYPMSYPYRERAKGKIAATVTSWWNIEFDDIAGIRRRAETIGLERAVNEWIARRAFKCSQIYEIRAREAFKKLGLLK